MPVHYQDPRIRVHKIKCGPYDNNAYLVVDLRTQEGVVIDAPAEPEKVLQEAKDIQVRALLITHTHMDHLLGFGELHRGLKVPVGCHPDDAAQLPRPADFALQDGDTLKVGALELRLVHTPGHTPGSTCFLVDNHLFSGDTLFPGGPGKSRTPQDFRRVVQSITEKLLVLPDEVEVYPGHGENTTLQRAKQEYQVFASRPHPEGLCGDVLWLES